MKIYILLLCILAAPSFAEKRGISPDPFDEIDSQVSETSDSGTQSDELEPETSQEDFTLRPTIVSLAPNINDFGRFADGGSDSNWYIGFDNAWIVKLPPVPEGSYSRAFIGAKLGRAKTVASKDKPWERIPIQGKVYLAISQRPGFSAEQSFFLVEAPDIPLEAHESVYMPGVGISEWFWAEIPPNMASSQKPNYLIIWSPTREFRNAAHSPVLAALQSSRRETSEETQAWNNHSIQGVPPRSESGTLQVPINLKPAIAIKLIPSGAKRSVKISASSANMTRDGILFKYSVTGTDIQDTWAEASKDGLEWLRVSSFKRTPPFTLTLPRTVLTPRGVYLRAKARDIMANEGTGSNVFLPGEGIR